MTYEVHVKLTLTWHRKIKIWTSPSLITYVSNTYDNAKGSQYFIFFFFKLALGKYKVFSHCKGKTLLTSGKLSGKNPRAWVWLVSYLKINKWKLKYKTKKKSWEPFRSCLLNSAANPAQFGWKLAGLRLWYFSLYS